MFTGFAFFENFADTEYRGEIISQSQENFFFEYLGCFMVISTTLGVAQNHIFRTGRGNHSGRNLSGIGTRSLVGTVFRSNTDFFRIDSLSHRRKMYERRTDNHIAIYFFTSQSGFNTFCQCQTFLQGLIHFPVPCHNVFSHNDSKLL